MNKTKIVYQKNGNGERYAGRRFCKFYFSFLP